MEPMPTPWYQFSLRSLLLLTLFVAICCSIGVYTHWELSVAVCVGGIAGRIAARRELGYLVGAVFGATVAFIATFLTLFVVQLGLRYLPHPEILWRMKEVLVIVAAFFGVVLGGILGGLLAKKQPEV
jgi:MFS family permease